MRGSKKGSSHISDDILYAMRLVLDTDVIVSAMRSPSGASVTLLLSALEGKVCLFANVPLVIECEAAGSHAEPLFLGQGRGVQHESIRRMAVSEKLAVMRMAAFF